MGTLIGLLICCNAMLIVMGLSHQWYWFAVFAGIESCVLVGELTSYIVSKKTISTRWGEWFKIQPVQAVISLILFALAMLFLEIHIIGYFF